MCLQEPQVSCGAAAGRWWSCVWPVAGLDVPAGLQLPQGGARVNPSPQPLPPHCLFNRRCSIVPACNAHADEDIAAAMEVERLSADDPIGMLSSDPDRFFGRTAKVGGWACVVGAPCPAPAFAGAGTLLHCAAAGG